ncbi:MAG: Ig-like domain-containing protein [Alistipes sp.]|jgi:hypothetical protein|nr:Ig-like domain-containing protein [Alistipes sp.]
MRRKSTILALTLIGVVAMGMAACDDPKKEIIDEIEDVLVTEIELSLPTLDLLVGDKETLTVDVLPADAANRNVEWSSDATDVATVTGGVVTAVAVGEAKITATATDESGVTAVCTVTVERQPDVYVGGRVTYGSPKAVLWVNGVEEQLFDRDAFVFSIDIAENDDVYVAGWALDSKYAPEALLWKNGVAAKLSETAGIAHSVVVSGDDVYVAGMDYGTENVYKAILWKNGEIEWTGPNYSDAATLCFSGDDMYITGYVDRDGSRLLAVWKNGVEEILSEGNVSAYPYQMFVSGEDVYVAGVVDVDGGQNPANQDKATLWKNGVPQTLSNVRSQAYTVYVSGEDVYVGGYVAQDDVLAATIWKNGVEETMSDKVSQVTHINGFGDDIYMVGYIMDPTAKATLWKNGVPSTLGDNADAYYVYLK